MHGAAASLSRTCRRSVSEHRINARKLGHTIYEVCEDSLWMDKALQRRGGGELAVLRKRMVENEAAENPGSKAPLLYSTDDTH
jgi:hypothetical protein